MKKMLVVYYSWSNGNTKRIAEQLTNGTGADIARIETTEPYSGSHEDVVEQGKREVEAGFMPQINPISVNLADYDVIAIGTPTWWYTMAPAVLTFLTTNISVMTEKLILVSLHQLHMIRYITDITDLENVWEMLLRMEQS